MKIFIYILLIAATGLLLYNTTFLDMNALLEGDSKIALISIIASAIVILLLIILLISKAIQKKVNG